LALGYEELIDRDALRYDPALAAVNKPGETIARKLTLTRKEHASKIGKDRQFLHLHSFPVSPSCLAYGEL